MKERVIKDNQRGDHRNGGVLIEHTYDMVIITRNNASNDSTTTFRHNYKITKALNIATYSPTLR